MAAALIAIGSNLGDRQRILDDAVVQLAALPGIRLVAKSRWHATRPVGGPPGQGEFLNGAALIETTLSPEQLHAALKQIESDAGRKRAERWAPRTLDLDLLLYDELVIDTPELTVPHPRMAFRRFVLEPAAEIAPAMRHPTIGWTILELRDHVRARSPYVAAITGLIAADKSALATAVATALAGRVIADPEPLDLNFGLYRRDRLGIERAIELLERRARPIRMTAWASSSFMAISDYWFHEAVFWGTVGNSNSEYLDQYRGQAAWVADPRLLVLLESSEGGSWFETAILPAGPKSAKLIQAMVGPFRALLQSTITEKWRGPLLRLDGTKLDEAKDELIAAIQAMQ
jgi:2-amino-4-hydroxy-6-hydroxymethyldihydropteridine diphosphokinase